MPQEAIFAPVFLVMLLTFAVWIYMYVRRITFLESNKIKTADLAMPGELARISPAGVSNPSDNLKNLFELPVLFYAMALYLFVTAQVDLNYVIAAWDFAVFRVLHSLVHCTINVVMLRFYMYVLSALALFYMIVRAAWTYFLL
jgi:hypothetical protein